MVTRKLRSHTVIPPDLYIRRAADDQLREIISDMGRPGYVLVARQMGKTNLLLNARRELRGPEDLFVYLDVSNAFPELRGFYRNIIDVALEALLPDEVFLQGTIQQSRTDSTSLPPHKEHEVELRRLLQAVAGKVVIFLDEVDALTKSDYSDQVFSFIRSVYFSGRANFEEFSRLTYVLSGVAEPGDLIQNKAVSPFNIGEKIYLDDFSKQEFDAFLKSADLTYSEDVCSRIFFWVEGHPRMTWDLCAALERKSRETLSVADVDVQITELYFGSVNVPPIDHIKDLVSQSKDLRDSVMAIHYKKTDVLTDSARTRLYLAGISRFDTEKRIATFKNPVMERALSEDFIRSIDSVDTTQLDVGIKLFGVHQFADALSLFSSIARSSGEARLRNSATQWVGLTHFQMGSFSNALQALESMDEIEEEQRFVHSYYKGLSHLNLGNAEAAISCLRSALKLGASNDVYYYDAKVTLAMALTAIEPLSEVSKAEAKQICDELIAMLRDNGAQASVIGPGTLVTAYRTLSKISRDEKDIDAALRFLREGRVHAAATDLLDLTLSEISLTDHVEQVGLLNQAVDAVKAIKIFSLSALENQTTLKRVGTLLETLDVSGRRNDAVGIADHVLDHLSPSDDLLQVIEALVFSTFSRGYGKLGASLVQKILSREEVKRSPFVYKNIVTYASLFDDGIALQYGASYVQACGKSRETSGDDAIATVRGLFAVFAAAVRNSTLDLAEDAARSAGEILIGIELGVSSVASAELLRDYMQTLAAVLGRRDRGSVQKAGLLIRRLSSLKSFEFPLFPKDFHRQMHRDLAYALSVLPTETFVNQEKKIGRNDWVVVNYNGEEREGKYKKFIQDIEAGRCVFVREVTD